MNLQIIIALKYVIDKPLEVHSTHYAELVEHTHIIVFTLINS